MMMDGWRSSPLSHESTKVFLLLGFVQKRRVPHFSLFKVINGWFSLCHLQRDLQSSARSDQDTLGNDASIGTNALHYITNTVAVQDAERKSMSQCELMTHTCPPCLRYWLSCVLWPRVRVRARPINTDDFGLRQQISVQYSTGLCCICTTSASSTHKLPLSHTNTAIIQSLLSAWCCTVLCNMLLLSYLLFSSFVSLPSALFSPPPFRRFQFWSSGWHWRRTSSKSVWTTRARLSSSSREETRCKYGCVTHWSHQI